MRTWSDCDGGSWDYTLDLDPGRLPGHRGGWTVTLCTGEDGLFQHALLRFFLASTDRQLVKTRDGHIEICVQESPPAADQMPNWLPAPPGRFSMVMRTYWGPDDQPGSWQPVLRARAVIAG
jgi:hypothetical protein